VARLGELLLQEKLVTGAQLEEALETQVIHGGRLGTNLVELGFVKEADLARVLGKLHNMPFSAGEMIPDPQALALTDRQYYDDQDVIPMRVDATRLTVAVLGPNQLKAIDALGFKAGKRVVAVLIPEFRMNQLLRVHSKAFRPMRPIDMNALRPSKKKDSNEPSLQDVGDLINEDEFAKIYAQAAVGGASAEAEEEVIEGSVIEDDVPAPLPSAPRPEKDHDFPPLTFAEAQAQLQKDTNREDIAITVLRFARSKFRRALLLNVQGELVTGWHGMGQGVKERAVRRIGVTLREANTFQLVAKLKSHFVGPMKHTPNIDIFYQLLRGDYPQTAVALPLLVRGKIVHILYVDQGPKQVTPPDVGELLILSQSVARSYEALIRQRQAARAN
jgi:hypothetical protein